MITTQSNCAEPEESDPHGELAHVSDVVVLGPEREVAHVGEVLHLEHIKKYFHFLHTHLVSTCVIIVIYLHK